MAVGFDAGITTGNSADGLNQEAATANSISTTGISVGGLASLLLAFFVWQQSGGTDPTSRTCTWNGVSMTEGPTRNQALGFSQRVSIFYLASPAAGANTLAGAWTGVVDGVYLGAGSYTGANGIVGGDSVTAVDATQITVTSGANDATAAVFGVDGSTPTTNFTKLWAEANLAPGGGTSWTLGGSSNIHTFTGAGGTHQVLAAVHILAAAAAAAAVGPTMPVVIWGRNKIRMSRLPSAQSVGAIAVAYVWLPTGGFALGGTAPVNKGKVYAVSGGLTFGGTAPVNKGKIFVVSGGLVFGGVATTLYTPSGAVDYVYTPSGGLVFGGTAPYNKGKVFAVSGGIVFAGTAPWLKGKAFAPSGGLVFGGNAVLLKGKVYVVSGGLTFGGIAPYEFSGTVVVAAIHTINSPLNVGTLLNRS